MSYYFNKTGDLDQFSSWVNFNSYYKKTTKIHVSIFNKIDFNEKMNWSKKIKECSNILCDQLDLFKLKKPNNDILLDLLESNMLSYDVYMFSIKSKDKKNWKGEINLSVKNGVKNKKKKKRKRENDNDKSSNETNIGGDNKGRKINSKCNVVYPLLDRVNKIKRHIAVFLKKPEITSIVQIKKRYIGIHSLSHFDPFLKDKTYYEVKHKHYKELILDLLKVNKLI